MNSEIYNKGVYGKLGIEISEKNVAFAFKKILDLIETKEVFIKEFKENNINVDNIVKILKDKDYENKSESYSLGIGEDIDLDNILENNINCPEITLQKRIREIININETSGLLLFSMFNIDDSNALYAIWSNEYNCLLGVGYLHLKDLNEEPTYKTYLFWKRK